MMDLQEFKSRVEHALESMQAEDGRTDENDTLENWIDELEVHLRAEE